MSSRPISNILAAAALVSNANALTTYAYVTNVCSGSDNNILGKCADLDEVSLLHTHRKTLEGYETKKKINYNVVSFYGVACNEIKEVSNQILIREFN